MPPSGRWLLLSQALRHGSLEDLRSLLANLPEDPQERQELLLSRDEDGLTALHAAVQAQNCEGLDMLLAAVAENKGEETLRKLLAATAGSRGRTALHMAAAAGPHALAGALVAAAPAAMLPELLMQQEGEDGDTVLHLAVNRGSTDLLVLLLTALPEDDATRAKVFAVVSHQEVERRGAAPASPVKGGHRRVVQLVQKNRRQSVLHVSAGTGTVLHRAAWWDAAWAVQLLMAEAAEGDESFVCRKNTTGITALHLATIMENAKAAVAIMEHFPMKELWAQREAKDSLQAALDHSLFDMVSEITGAAPRAVSEGDVVESLMTRGTIGTALIMALAQPLVALEEKTSNIVMREWIPMLVMGSDPRIQRLKLSEEGSLTKISNTHVEELPQAKSWLACNQRAVRCHAHILPQHLLDSRAVVTALATSPTYDALHSPYAQGLVTRWWESKTKWFYFFDIFLNFLRLAVAAWLTHELRANTFGALTRALGFAIVLVVKDTLDEVLQLMHARSRYFLNGTNLVDGLRVLLEIMSLALIWMASGGDPPPGSDNVAKVSKAKNVIDKVTASSKAVIGAWAAMTWFHTLTGLRGLRFIGPRLIPIIKAVLDINVLSLAFVLTVIIFGATHAYYVFGIRDEPSFAYAAFIQIFRLGVMGDVNLEELEGQEPMLVSDGNGTLHTEEPPPSSEFEIVQILFLVVSLGIAVVLMNLFIGVLSNNYDRFQEISEELFLRARARLIVQYEVVALPKLFVKLCGSAEDENEDDSDDAAVVVFTRWEGSAEDNHSVRSYMKRSIQAQSRSLEEVFKRSQEEQEKQVLDSIVGLEEQLRQLREQVNRKQPAAPVSSHSV